MTTTKSNSDLMAEAKLLEAVEHLVETNEGTYGATEACRKVGSGDPMFADRKVYETVGGQRRETGCDEKDAPGRMRKINRESLNADRKRLADLRREIRRI